MPPARLRLFARPELGTRLQAREADRRSAARRPGQEARGARGAEPTCGPACSAARPAAFVSARAVCPPGLGSRLAWAGRLGLRWAVARCALRGGNGTGCAVRCRRVAHPGCGYVPQCYQGCAFVWTPLGCVCPDSLPISAPSVTRGAVLCSLQALRCGLWAEGVRGGYVLGVRVPGSLGVALRCVLWCEAVSCLCVCEEARPPVCPPVHSLQPLLQADQQPTSAVCPEGGASWRKRGGPSASPQEGTTLLAAPTGYPGMSGLSAG